jgi:hypothetical protein
MAVTLNALTTGVGGLQTSGDTSGQISLQSNGSTVLTTSSTGVTITGTLTASGGGAISETTIYGTAITAGSFVVGSVYTIAVVGTTSFTAIGASANTAGITFVATGAGSGTGTAYNYYVGSNSTGSKTISTSTPSGGNDGDIWYQV